MIKAANGSGWINHFLMKYSKEKIKNYVSDERYFHEVNKKLSMRISLSNKTLFSFTELFEKTDNELFQIIEEYKI